jgi:chaperonin GroEL
VIKVGAYTENEQKSIKTKVENAINSTQIAYKGGVVPGAGKVLLDIQTSSELLNRALKAPRTQLETNGAKYLDEKTVDPADVVITALESAVSIAEGLLTMGGIVVPKREKKDNDRITY